MSGGEGLGEDGGVHVVFADAGGGAGHGDGVVVGDGDLDGAAGHVDGDVGFDEADFAGDGGCGGAAGAGGEGVAGAAFPDFDADVGAVEDFEELDVGAAWEVGVVFDGGAEAVGEVAGDVGEGDDAVGVADGGGVDGEGFAGDVEGFGEDFPVGAGDGDLAGAEGDAAHFDGDALAALADEAGDAAAGGEDGEGFVFADEAAVVEVAGEDAEAVAGFFGFGAVGVEDAEGEIGVGGFFLAVEDAVGAEAVVAVADLDDLVGGGRVEGFEDFEDEVVVAEGVVFGEGFHGCGRFFVVCGCGARWQAESRGAGRAVGVGWGVFGMGVCLKTCCVVRNGSLGRTAHEQEIEDLLKDDPSRRERGPAPFGESGLLAGAGRDGEEDRESGAGFRV